MRSLITSLSARLATRSLVPVNRCVHFCAYRYGRNEPNPYEQFAQGLAAGKPLDEVRSTYVDFLRRYQPLNLAQALGIQLSREYPLWFLPWRVPAQVLSNPGWVVSPSDVIDVMTYFSHGGIPRTLIDKEFSWSENAFRAISEHGYQPERFSYISVRELRRGHESSYLVIDGNHRISAISALGQRAVTVRKLIGQTVERERSDRWPLVRAGLMSQVDALSVFDGYFDGNLQPFQLSTPAEIFPKTVEAL